MKLIIFRPLVKGGKKGNLGEHRNWNGKEYVKTEKGWRPVGKGTRQYVKQNLGNSNPKLYPKGFLDIVNQPVQTHPQVARVESAAKILASQGKMTPQMNSNLNDIRRLGQAAMFARSADTNQVLRAAKEAESAGDKDKVAVFAAELKRRHEAAEAEGTYESDKKASATFIGDVARSFSSDISKLRSPLQPTVKYSEMGKEILVLYDTPRQFRHPDEYYGAGDYMEDDPAYIAFSKQESAIVAVMDKYSAKYPNYRFEGGGDVSGGDYKRA